MIIPSDVCVRTMVSRWTTTPNPLAGISPAGESLEDDT
jgi:hypothetical protein